ncbi:MAG: lipopolysaccharide biosynthesis protein [Pirellulales bacterium]|nr:lipopolysaccharide biosynthesis protein [Pirellulales bacterium]
MSAVPASTEDSLHADPWRPETLLAGVAILLTLTFVQRLVGFVRAILFCRYLEAEQLGLWDMSFGFLMLAGPLAVLALPGTFGRYVEYFRQQNQLRTFLLRTLVTCFLLAGAAVAILTLQPGWFSKLIFGTTRWQTLILALAGCLSAVVAYNYCISLFTALRCVRWAAAMEFVNGVTFAVLGVILVLLWRSDALAVVGAYTGSSLLCVLGAALGLRLLWRRLPAAEPLPAGGVWKKIAPFAAWVLLINLLTNLFGFADRYMIVHFAPGTSAETLSLAGQYHSSRVVPLLFVSLASMLATVLLPHLSHDWETGRRERVGRRLNLFLKLLALGLLGGCVVVLAAAPWLFHVAFRGKFAAGLAVLPWTLTYCIWFGVLLMAQQYLWCVEKAGRVSLALAVGLAVNVGLNLLLLPVWGLLGAALAAAAAHAIALLLVLGFARLRGLPRDRGLTALVCAAPALCLGPAAAAVILLIFAWAAVRTNLVFSPSEKELLAEKWRECWEKWSKVLGARGEGLGIRD